MSTKTENNNEAFSIKTIIGPLLAVIVGMIMVILDSTAMNVALPGIVEDFKSDVSTMQWSITGYTLALAVLWLAHWLDDGPIWSKKDIFNYDRLVYAWFRSMFCCTKP